eukprot:TRINITY_DN5601_c0_g1_i2.p1 TRINITY_DN5601_c0_g1~~TRINITY_DN5601_c0_g1_i2.p1  ORF type:complete len:128 (-),score=10.77 TRINITY_DN5601_c0_g1_i2:365-748(-)
MELPFTIQDLEMLWKTPDKNKGGVWNQVWKQLSLPEYNTLWKSMWGWQGLLVSTISFATLSGLANWYLMQAVKKECEGMEKENHLLREKTENMIAVIRKLKGTHAQINGESVVLRKRMTLVEENVRC